MIYYNGKMSERKAYQLAYYLKDKERMLKQDAEWYQNNKEHVKRRIYAYNDATNKLIGHKSLGVARMYIRTLDLGPGFQDPRLWTLDP